MPCLKSEEGLSLQVQINRDRDFSKFPAATHGTWEEGGKGAQGRRDMRGQFPVLVVSALALGSYLTVQKTVEHRHEEALRGRGESEVSGV